VKASAGKIRAVAFPTQTGGAFPHADPSLGENTF
jgi:hypothetical protein